jgi:endo-1,4-beta-xylanase
MFRQSSARAAGPSLREVSERKGILFGTAIRGSSLLGNPAYSAMINDNCDLIVSAGEMHWAIVAPNKQGTEFRQADQVAGWADAHHVKLRGHALSWHAQAPKWFAELPDRNAATAALQDHVQTMCTHFAGRIYSWDVVNEALQPQPTLQQPMRKSVFLDKIGPDFVEIAFQTARAADPRAVLVYNEYGVELDQPPQRLKQEVLLRYVGDMKRRGVPIDAVGIQSHLRAETMQDFNERRYSDFLRSLAGLGVKIMLTELDVADRGAPGDIAQRDAAVASIYKRYLDVALANRSVTAVVTWSLTDGDSWITRGDMPQFIRADGQSPRPLPFDAQFRRKPACDAIVASIAAAPGR